MSFFVARKGAFGIAGAILFLLGLVAMPNLMRSKFICVLTDSPDRNLKHLEMALVYYRAIYNAECPPGLAALGPPAEGRPASAEAAELIGADVASGTKRGYTFRLTCDRGKNTITADPVDNRPDQAHFFVDETLVVREEEGRAATSSSPPSRRHCDGMKRRKPETPEAVTWLLYDQIQNYQWIYKRYPSTLSDLGPPFDGLTPDADAAYLVDAENASGNRFGYAFRYQSDGAGGFTINADPDSQPLPLLAWLLEKPHYFIDQTGSLRQEAHRPAGATSRKL